MRIFFAAPATAHQAALPKSTLWHANLCAPLVDLGHDVTIFDFDYKDFNWNLDPTDDQQRRFIETHRPRFSEELVAQFLAAHRKEPIDLFFSYFYSSYVEPEAIRTIGRAGAVTMNWYCNASYQFHLVEEIAPAYDYCLVPERFRLENYRAVGATPIYCQEAANAAVYKPYDLPVEFDATFVGQRYADRGEYLRRLLDAGIDTRAWGPNWTEPDSPTSLVRTLKDVARGRPRRAPRSLPPDRCGPALSDDEYIRMYSRSAMSLGFTKVAVFNRDGSAIRQVRLRDFEATMSGAFYLVERCDELFDFFEPDREVVVFDEPEELVEKATYYLANETERTRIRKAGLLRARRDHTWHARFRMVFAKIGLV
ncbi:MAG TPA: glycosyltransferase [Gaiellaceae bacterium]|nr:glycosyltransferase [Gaiellaceae bacterium]